MNPQSVQRLFQNSGDISTTYVGSRTSKLGVEENITLDETHRLTHVLNIGPTGHGKTQLLTHAALQDAEKDRGLCIINPKGDLIAAYIAKLHDDRIDDIIYINPAQEPVTPINVLEPYITEEMNTAQKENQKEIIISDLIDLFKRQSENWGDQFGRVLETLLRAHLDLNIKQTESNTLIDVFQCVTQDNHLTKLEERVQDPVISEHLIRIKQDLSSYDMNPLQHRLNDFVMNPTIRRVIGTSDSSINFRDAVNNGKIILVDIQKGEVGETVSNLVGSIVITKIWAAAQSRITQSIDHRTPFYLYVDEIQNFAGEGSNFTKILGEAREYRLGCWLATQYLHQLNTDMRRAVTNNCRTKIFFEPSGSEDLGRITDILKGIDKSTLNALGKYRAALQKPSERTQRGAITFDTYPPWKGDYSQVNQIKQKQTAAVGTASEMEFQQSLGNQANAGGEKHQELLAEAKKQLDERGFQATLLHQGHEEEKPDGHVLLPDGERANLEAEHSTLSKPAKVLRNLRRGHEEGREVFFIVEEGKENQVRNHTRKPRDSIQSRQAGRFGTRGVRTAEWNGRACREGAETSLPSTDSS